MTNEYGSRRRIVTPTPPAPVPEKRIEPVQVVPEEDKSTLRGSHHEQEADSNSSIVRATGTMAIATLFSRITGFLRQMLIGATLGEVVGTAFGTANQIPNLITEIVLGAVLTSLVVPVLVRAEKEDSDNGRTFVRRLFTLAMSILAVVTILSIVFAPLITRLMVPEDSKVNAFQATSMAYLLLPQILFYGLFALFQAILNTKNVFGPGAWAPVINNVISITVLLMYRLLPGELDPTAASPVTDKHVILLGLGTTLGVVVQCLILVPYLVKAKIDLRPKWGIDHRIKQFGGMALAIIVYVAISQAGYIVTSQVASYADHGAMLVYQNAWLMLQVPYGVIGVTLLTAIMPRLSRNAANGDVEAVVRDLTLGSKLTLIALIPIVIFMTGFGIPIARALFQYGAYGASSAEQLGLTISFSAFTLIPYALVLLHLRVFYAREETWTPTFIIAGITATKIALTLLAPMVADSTDRVVILLGTANGFGFLSGAVIGGFLLKRKLGSLGGRELRTTVIWSTLAGGIGLLAATALHWCFNLVLPDSIPSIVYLLEVAFLGVVFVVVAGIVLSRSGLPEVINLGRQLQRIPGMSKIIKIEHAEAIEIEEPEVREIQPVYTADAFNSSPVPPPMSAGIVRGPSLVPGAPVSDGRFRLLKDYGSVPGARFWKAREQSSGRLVSLTFVDTTGEAPLAPATPAVAARRSAEISRNTRKLSELHLSAIASNIKILSYRQGCLVVADWIEGTPLKTVAEDHNLDPKAVARALAPLVADIATAHENGLVLGLDNRSRVQIGTDGVAKLAFPAVLERNTEETDLDGINSTITLLTEAAGSSELQEIADSEDGLAERAQKLEEFAKEDAELEGEGEAPEVHKLDVPEEKVEQPEAIPGFGGRGYSGSGAIVLGVFATVFVVLMAALTAWIMSLVGDDSPVSKPSTSVTSFPNTPPVLLKEKEAFTVPDNKPQKALIDGKTADRVNVEEGALVTLEKKTQLHVLQLSHYGATGNKFTVYGVDMADFDPKDPEGTELAEGKLSSSKQDIELEKVQEGFDGVLIMFDGKTAVSEMQVVGLS